MWTSRQTRRTVGSAETRRNPLFGLFRCRYPCRLPNRLPIRGLVSGSKRQPRRAHSSSKHGGLHGSGADAVWRQKRIRHGACPLRSARAAVTLRSLLACAHLAPRVVADPSSSSCSAAPPQHEPRLRLRLRLRQGQHPPRAVTTGGRKKRSDLSADLARAPPRSAPIHRISAHGRRLSGGDLCDRWGLRSRHGARPPRPR